MNTNRLVTDFPAVRRVMGVERNTLDDDSLEDLLTELFPGAEPEDVEDFMGSVQNFAKQAAPVAQRALPGAAKGAVQGAAIGGPWGALIGAAGGAAGSALAGGGPARGAPAISLPSALPSAPAGAATAASAQLLALLSRPETIQALLALLLSGSGRSCVSVGDKQIPAAAFANAIAETAALVADAATPVDAPMTEYLFDDDGQARADIASPSARAALLLSDLADVAAAEAYDDEWEDAEYSQSTAIYEEAGAHDPLDDYEAALHGRGAYGS
jgi:hypothetical protein